MEQYTTNEVVVPKKKSLMYLVWSLDPIPDLQETQRTEHMLKTSTGKQSVRPILWEILQEQ